MQNDYAPCFCGKLKRNALPSSSSVEMKQLIDFRGDLVAQERPTKTASACF